MAFSKQIPEKSPLTVIKQMTAAELLNAYQVSSTRDRLVPEASRQTVHSLTVAVGDFSCGSNDEDIFEYIDGDVNCTAIGYFAPSMKLLMKEDGPTPALIPTINHSTKFNCLHFYDGDCSAATVQQIIAAFPAVTELTFVSDSEHDGEMKRLTEMLSDGRWSRQLSSLKLIIYINTPYIEIERLFDAINALPALKHLTLHLGEEFKLYELPVIERLETLSIRCLSKDLPFLLSQCYAARNDRLQLSVLNDEESLEKLIALRPHLRDRIVRLGRCSLIPRVRPWYNLLTPVCSVFPSLTSLELEIVPADAAKVFTLLAKLQHLVHLSINLQQIARNTDDVQAICPPEDQLLSVKGLELLALSFDSASHDELQLLNLPQTMPGIRAAHLGLYSCRSCNVDICDLEEDSTPAKLASARQCASAVLRFLRQATGLLQPGSISFEGEKHLGSVEELLAE